MPNPHVSLRCSIAKELARNRAGHLIWHKFPPLQVGYAQKREKMAVDPAPAGSAGCRAGMAGHGTTTGEAGAGADGAGVPGRHGRPQDNNRRGGRSDHRLMIKRALL